MKKVVNSVLASALALSVAPMAVGAEEAAQTAANPALDQAVKRLQALELLKGDEKGNLNLDQPITRAEFATLVVRARGLASGVPLAQYQSRFSDVKASDWFSGWVNVAAGQQLIKGYPDNTFKPNANVTYAEAVTMLVRALGYEPSVGNDSWPNNFIAKAAELGISDGVPVSLDRNKPALRGDVALLLDNSLTIDLMKQVTYGTQIEYKAVEGTSLLEDYLGIKLFDMDWANDTDRDRDPDDLPFVEGVPTLELGDLAEDEVRLTSPAATSLKGIYKVAPTVNPNNFLGQHVQVWLKDSTDTILWMEGSTDEEVIVDKFTDFLYDNDELTQNNLDDKLGNDPKKLRLKLSNGSRYSLAVDRDGDVTTKFYYNYQEIDDWQDFVELLAEYGNFAEGHYVKVVLNDTGDIAYLQLTDDVTGDRDDDYKFGSEVVKEIDAEDQTIEFMDSGKDLDLEDDKEGEDFIVIRNGERATFADIKPLDVVSVYYPNGDDNKKIIVAYAQTVEGKIDEITIKTDSDNRLKIGDTVYRTRGEVTYSDDNNETAEVIDNDELRDLEGDEVILHLDSSGRIRHITAKEEASSKKTKAVVVKDAYFDEGRGELVVDVYTEKGSKVTLTIKDEDDVSYEDDSKKIEDWDDVIKALDVVSNKKPVFIEYELEDDGDVKKLKILDDELLHASATDFEKNSDEEDQTVKIGGKGYDVTDKTVIFDLTGPVKQSGKRDYIDDPALTKWNKIAEEEHEVYAIVDDGDIEYLFVVGGKRVTSDGEIAQVVDVKRRSGDYYATLIGSDGEQKEVAVDGDFDDISAVFGRYDVIYYEVNSDEEIDLDTVKRIVDVDQSGDAEKRVNGVYRNLTKLDEVDFADEDYLVAVARVDDLNGKKITYEKSDETVYYNLSDSAVYVDLEANKLSRVRKDDLVVLIDSDDESSKIDFVLVVGQADDLDDNTVAEFLAQDGTEPGDPGDPGDPGNPEPWEEVFKAEPVVTVIDGLGAGTKFYRVEGDLKELANTTITIKVGSQSKEVQVDANGHFVDAVLADQGETTVTITVDGEDYEFEI